MYWQAAQGWLYDGHVASRIEEGMQALHGTFWNLAVERWRAFQRGGL